MAAGPMGAAIWPHQLAGFKKTAGEPVKVTADQPLWAEYGLEIAEQADYASPAGRRFHAVAWRLKDSTSALAVFQWKRPPDARPSKLAPLAAQTRDAVLLAHGNYVLQVSGWNPKPGDLQPMLAGLPKVDTSPLPTLLEHLPSERLVANSERYVIGPAALEKFDPGISRAAAGFQFGAEAQIAQYQTKGGSIELAVFSYPTAQMARLQQAEFRKLPDAIARRVGPLVGVILSPPDRAEAERLLAGVWYQQTLTWNERVPTAKDNFAELILNIFVLIGILLALFVVAGLIFGFLRRWLGWGTSGDAIIMLHLEDR